MKRPLTTSFSAPAPAPPVEPEPARPPEPSWRQVAPIVTAVLAVLDVVETAPRSGPAARVHRSFIRSEGEAAVALGGPEAMEAVLRQVLDADLGKAKARKAILGTAWSDLPGWRP